MSQEPACSVVIPTYNRKDLLGRTLDALTRQDLGRDRFEVLIGDDGSSDGTAEVVAGFMDRLNLRYFYQPDEGFRAAAARNLGIANARADVCVFLDSGVLPHSGCLSAHLRRHAGPEPTAVAGYVYCFNHDNDDAAEMLATLDFSDPDRAVATLREQRRWLDDRESFWARYDDDLSELPAPWLMWWTCNTSAPTALVREVGGFDETFRSWGMEDCDLGYRLFQAGARFVVERDAAALHHPHEKDHQRNKQEQQANLRRFAAKYDTPITRLLLDPPVSWFDINDYARQESIGTR